MQRGWTVSFLEHPWIRAVGFVSLSLVWGGALFCMGVIAATGFEVALEPPHENKLVGIVWVLFGAGIPVGLAAASAMLYWGWAQLVEAHGRLAKSAAYSVPGAAVGFVAGLLGTFQIWGAIVMAAALLFHLVAMVGVLVAALAGGHRPWAS